MKCLFRFIVVSVISIFVLTACGGGGSQGSGGGTPQHNIKEEIRLAVLSINSLMIGVINSVDDVIDNALIDFNCNFNTTISTSVRINGAPHNLYASGKAKFFNNNNPVDCNYFFSNDYFLINKAEISGGGNVNGSELNSNFQGQFGINGNTGYLVSGDVFSNLAIADYLIVNGVAKITNTSYAGQQLPDLTGNVNNVIISAAEAFSLLDRASYGAINLGEGARVITSGDIYAQSSSCNNINIRFNGTSLIDVYSPCTSPTHFKVDVDTGKIIE